MKYLPTNITNPLLGGTFGTVTSQRDPTGMDSAASCSSSNPDWSCSSVACWACLFCFKNALTESNYSNNTIILPFTHFNLYKYDTLKYNHVRTISQNIFQISYAYNGVYVTGFEITWLPRTIINI